MLTASSIVVALALSATAGVTATESTAPAAAPVALSEAVKSVPVPPAVSPARPRVEAWMVDRLERRPAALPVLYGSLGTLNVLDAYSTRRAIDAGAYEANPLMRQAAGSMGSLLAVKAASTAAAIYFSERAWKKNRKGAVIVMAIANGVTAAIVARNLRNAR